MRVIEDMYSAAKWEYDPGWDSLESIEKEIEGSGTNKQGSTGYGEEARTIAEAIEKYGVAEIARKVKTRIEQFKDSANPIGPTMEYFIKREPTKRKKMVERRPRIIANMDYVTRIACSMFFNSHIRATVKNSSDIPTTYGYSWKGGGTDRMFRKYDDGKADKVEVDKKNYDATASGWGYKAYGEFVGPRQCRNWVDVPQRSKDFMWNVLMYLAKPGFIHLSNGLILEQIEEGIMKSGAKITIDKNSFDQVYIRVWYEEECNGGWDPTCWILATGDDTLERLKGAMGPYLDFINSKGFVAHEALQGRMLDLSYVGLQFRRLHNGVVVSTPKYYDKNLWSLKYKEKNKVALFPETLRSFCIEYAWSDHFPYFHKLLRDYGGRLYLSEEACQSYHLY